MATTIVYNGHNYAEVNDLIKKYGKAKVSYDGKTFVAMRLFVSTNNDPCYFPKGYRRRGRAFSLGVTLVFDDAKKSTKSKEQKMREKCQKVISYLNKSGFWENLKEACQALIDASDEDLVRFLSYKETDSGYGHYEGTPECVMSWKEALNNLYHDNRALRTVNFGKFGDDRRKQVAEAVYNHSNLTLHWRESYDNSIEITDNRAWYSEEFRGCGNGHYLFLLDEKHVLYGERD